MKFLSPFILVLVCNIAFAQTPNVMWQNTIGGSSYDGAKCIRSTTDGGFIVCGHSNSPASGDKTENTWGTYDFWIIKTDAVGNIEWQNDIGSTDEDRAYAIEQTQDGGFIVCGGSNGNVSGDKTMNTNGSTDWWILKLDGAGVIQWQKGHGAGGIEYDVGMDIVCLPDGGFLIGGDWGDFDVHLLRLNANGDSLWVKNIDVSFNTVLNGLHRTADGGYIMGVKYFDGSSNQSTSIKIFKLDTLCNTQWQRTFNMLSNEYISDVWPTPDGGYIIGGYSSYNDTSEWMHDYWVIKTDPNGFEVWEKFFGSTGNDVLTSIQVTPDGGYMLGGYSNGPVSGEKTVAAYPYQFGNNLSKDYWIIRLNHIGEVAWQKVIGGNNDDLLFDLRVTSDNRYVLAGESGSGASYDKIEPPQGFSDFWIVKLNNDTLPMLLSVVVTDTMACPALPCDGDVTVALSGGALPRTYAWSNGASSLNLADVCNGTYSLTVTDAVGSTLTGSATVNNVVAPCAAPLFTYVNNVSATGGKVNWSTNVCAVKYRVRIKNTANGQVNVVLVNAPQTFTLLSNLNSSTQYEVKVRMQCSSSGSMLSPWSSPAYFTTTVIANCVAPTAISATATSNSTSTINWTSVTGANGYQLRYRIIGTITWTPIVVNNGLTTNTNISGLQPNTTYQYQLRTKCSVSPLTWSNYSAMQTFSTPLRLGENETSINVDVYPNPSSGVFTLLLHATQRSNATIDIMSIDGKLIQSQNALVDAGLNNFKLDGSRWSAGVYLLKISSGDGVFYRKVAMH